MTGGTHSALKPVWRGPYDSWGDAEAAAALDSPARPGSLFDSWEWLTRQATFRESIREGNFASGSEVSTRNSSLPLLAQGVESLRIVDLGGGSGWVFDLLRKSGVSIDEYAVIDRPEVCAYFLACEDGPRTFVTFDDWRELVREHRSWDVVYCNSALQYARSSELLVDIVRQFQPRWVLLDDTLVTRLAQDTFAVQVNSDKSEAVRFLSVAGLVRDLLPCGFHLVWRSPFVQPGYANRAQSTDQAAIANFPVPQTLLFRAG